APVSHHQAAVRLRESQIQGLLKNDNQLAMLFTLANLFRVDQMIRQWERSQ
ncbi:IS5 family transposase, partial [Escherichia coli]|nr:IS5 family transposase [Escherichia coli]